MKKSQNKSTKFERKRLVLHRDTMRTLVGGKVGGDGDGDTTACTGNETGCMGSAGEECAPNS